jgi:hypothetical protein
VEVKAALRRLPQQMPSGLRPPTMVAMRHAIMVLTPRKWKSHHWFNIHSDIPCSLSNRSMSEKSSFVVKFMRLANR